MLSLLKMFPGVVLLVVLSAAQDDRSRPSAAFIDVNVVTGDSEQILRNQTVVIEGDRIVEVGSADQVTAPSGATSINGAGKYLIPGIGEMHGHIPPPGDPELERVLFLYVANGVTTVRGMLGFPGQLELRGRVLRGELPGPTLYLAGPSFSGSSIDSPEQAEERVRRQKAEGWDLLKVHPGLTREEFDAMARTAREVGIRFAGHVPADVGLLHALQSGLETVDHLDGYIEHLDGERASIPESALREIARRTKEAKAWVVPTMILWETLLGTHSLETLKAYDGIDYMPRTQIERWITAQRERVERPGFSREEALRIAENRKRLLRVLSEEGVRILFGTDSPQQFSVPGFSIHRELRAMREAGMSPAEIIRSATANVGAYFASKDKFGLVKPGMRADLILLHENPLADLGAVQKRTGVMLRGRWIPEAEIQRLLAELEVGNRQSATE
ncbi:MAG: amidohydrolase [Acidobacteria bacterium]|nr:MAG: amidohydrolase [Acidobacteriota bacterium]